MCRTAMLLLVFCVSVPCFPAAESVTTDSPFVTKRIAMARALTIALQQDSNEIAATAGGDLHALPSIEKRISGNMREAKETIDELIEIQKIASPAQSEMIHRVTPLLRDLVDNTRNMLGHLTATPAAAHSDKSLDYLEAHLEIAKHLTSLILESLDHSKEDGAGHF